MSERSLHDILHGTIRVPLDIDVRLNIALESAEALAYLHSETASGILHGDVKPSNILLDDNFSPKILRMAPRKHIDYYIISGINYIDPLYLTTGLFTTKSETYSFGLVLLELITRKEASREWVGNFRASNYGQKGATELFDSDIVEPRNLVVLDSLTGLILECLENLDERPTMTYVARRLRETKDSLKILVEGGVPSRAIY
ncbi:hypothetical protein PR202_ga07296 [Eleusine coracana subsp. coracana]|uniref:Protein kinase domain-containing protein n=1 Tax=Eleusine coracana subsp. coracana TaxID=191504 RepID=A0AAV5BXP2_ELECO|nr:hypothetical protein PR202_ga07296 [Eleusine coracana subsp. coracana]